MSSVTNQDRHGSTFAALSERNFRRYAFGQVWSITGNNAQTVAIVWVVLKLTESAAVLGVVISLQYIPVLVLGPLLGSVADKFDRKRILVINQSLALTVALVLGAVSSSPKPQLWAVYLLSVLVGVINALDVPSRQAFLKDLVGKELLVNAIALNSLLLATARVLGPAIAAVLMTFVSVPSCFFFNAFTFGVVILTLLAIRTTATSARKVKHNSLINLKPALRYINDTPDVRLGLLVMAWVGTFTYEFWITVPVLVRHDFGEKALAYGLMMMALGIGSMVGGLFVARRLTAGRRELLIGTAAFGVSTTLVGLSPTLEVAFVMVFLMGAAYSVFVVMSNSQLQKSVADEFRGRVMALWTAAYLGSTAVGGPAMGWIASTYGARVALVLGGLVAIVIAGWGAFSYLGFQLKFAASKHA